MIVSVQQKLFTSNSHITWNLINRSLSLSVCLSLSLPPPLSLSLPSSPLPPLSLFLSLSYPLSLSVFVSLSLPPLSLTLSWKQAVTSTYSYWFNVCFILFNLFLPGFYFLTIISLSGSSNVFQPECAIPSEMVTFFLSSNQLKLSLQESLSHTCLTWNTFLFFSKQQKQD